MPASTFPTRSVPTSAALVKIAFEDFRKVCVWFENPEEGAKSEEAHRGYGESHDSATGEGDFESPRGAFFICRDAGADVREGGGLHANKASCGGGEAAHEEGDRLSPAVCFILKEKECPAENNGEEGDELKFAGHKDHGAFLNLH